MFRQVQRSNISRFLSKTSIRGFAKSKEEKEIVENFWKKNTYKGKRYSTSPWLFGLSALGVGLSWYFYANQYGSYYNALKQFEYNLDMQYFRFSNPSLFKKHRLLPPSSLHYTVVIDLKDLIYIRDNGKGEKRPQMRPYMDVFLEELSQRCEVIIWSSIDDPRVTEWLQNLEKKSPCFHGVFGYSECTVKSGRVIKDLTRLNRPLENVFHICSSPTFASYQPDNAIFIQNWDGDVNDSALLDVYVYLQYVVETHNPKTTDARKLLQKFKSVDLAEANHEVEKRYHDQILQNNQLTKERYAASVRSSQAAQNPLFKALGG